MGIKPSHTRPFLATASGPSPRSVAANPGMREIDMYVFGLHPRLRLARTTAHRLWRRSNNICTTFDPEMES